MNADIFDFRVAAQVASVADIRSEEGTFKDIEDASTWTIINTAFHPTFPKIRVLAESASDNAKPLCFLHRNAISSNLCDVAVTCFMQAGKMASTNRGIAAGIQHRDHTFASYDKGVSVNSSILGYIDSTHYNRPCRLTQFSQKHLEKYTKGLPFIEEINRCFSLCMPDAYRRQYEEAQKTRFRISNTSFSTVTVNYNFRTALHRDSGDYEHGFGNLVVCQKDVEGGWILFPRFRLAVQLQTGDFLAMDVHEPHCNTPIRLTSPRGYRLSFVCYLRNRLKECEKINKRLEHFSGTSITTEQICTQIFGFVNEPLPEKTMIGRSNAGKEWWSYQGQRFHIIYKNKRFVVHDVSLRHTIHNLWEAWEYAKMQSEQI